jgi:hypothetical protein
LEDLSSDGARAFFETDEDLVAGDTDGARWDVYENSGTVPVLLSDRQQAGADGEFDASIEGSSDDGTRVFFATGEPLLAADSDCTDPITCYTDVYQRSDSQTTLLTDRVQDSSDQEYAAHFEQATPSGTHVFFRTDEPLVAEDGDSNQDVYQHSDGDTTLLSDRVQPGPDALLAIAGFRGASSDGSRVFFNTDEPLLAEDGDEHGDLYERSGGTTTLLSDRKQPGPDALNEPAHFEDASDDGTRVVFNTNEPLLAGDGDSAVDLYLARLADPAPPLPDGGGGSGGGAGGGGAGGPLGGGLVVDLLAPTMGIAGGTIRAKATYVPVPLSCPAGEIVCTGTLALDTARPVAAQRRRRLRLGRASFRIPGGARRVVRVRLSRRNRRLLARRKRLRVVASANARDAAGNAKLTRRTLTVRAPKPRRRR